MNSFDFSVTRRLLSGRICGAPSLPGDGKLNLACRCPHFWHTVCILFHGLASSLVDKAASLGMIISLHQFTKE